jgi:hypothetical protein
MEGEVTKDSVEMALIRTETSAFEKVSDEAIDKYLAK